MIKLYGRCGQLQEGRRRSTLARTRLAATGGAVAEGNNPLPPAALVAAENAEWATGLFASGVGSEASDGALGALDNNEIIMATLQFGASTCSASLNGELYGRVYAYPVTESVQTISPSVSCSGDPWS